MHHFEFEFEFKSVPKSYLLRKQWEMDGRDETSTGDHTSSRGDSKSAVGMLLPFLERFPAKVCSDFNLGLGLPILW